MTATAALAGCTELAVRLGLRTRLDNVPISTVSASLVGQRDRRPVGALGPGQSADLIIVAVTPKGEQLVTAGAGGGKVVFDSYTVAASVVSVSSNGAVSMPSDPAASEGRQGQLRITPVGHPDIVTELDIPVRYDIAYEVSFSGANGASGADGIAGSDGSRGMDASLPLTDPATGLTVHQGSGGRGSDGGNGGDGSNGQNGSAGGHVHIWLRLADTQDARARGPLLQVKVASGSRQSLFLVDPHGGSLRVLADGGHGGRGGAGGRGGRGGSGGNGFPPGLSGLDGRAGSDGHAGSAGAGGTITVSVDPAAQPYLSSVSWSNRGGDGRAGPPPGITIEPLPALW